MPYLLIRLQMASYWFQTIFTKGFQVSQQTCSPHAVFFHCYLMPLIRILLLPYYAVVLTIAVFRAPNDIRWVTKSVQDQIKVPIEDNTLQRVKTVETRTVTMMVDEGLVAVADWLVDAEQSIDATKGGARPYQTIIDAVLYNRTLEMIEAGELDPPESLDKLITPFEDALTRQPDHHGLAVLTAMRHLQVGWTFRGCGYVYEITDKQWEKVGEHYARAAEILGAFDARALRSPSLAMAVHKLLEIEGASSKLDAVFDLWRELDPMSGTAFARHAFHSLPRWGGSYEKILVDARRFAAETADKWGMSAYAHYLIHLSDCEPEIFEHMDDELFEEAVHDLLMRRPEPFVVNFWLRELNVLASATKIRGEDTPAEARVRALAKRLRSHVIRTHLNVIDSSVWEADASLPVALVANEFKEEVMAGQHVVVDVDGRLTVHHPDPLA